MGEDICYGIIIDVSPGTNHVMDCLTLVDDLMATGIVDQKILIEAICKQAPNFAYSMNEISEQQCLKSAQEEFGE